MKARAAARRLARAATMLATVLSPVTGALAAELGLITGGERGTYFQFGQDLRKLARPSGISVIVHPSNGAVDNVVAVSRRPGIQLGIVQSDVLAFVAEQASNPAVTRIAQGLRLVFPLYDEEIHVLARREIAAFDQLAGKRVAIGREGSGTFLTARWLFHLAGVAPDEMLPVDAPEALGQLKAGRIDALVYVASQPVALFQRQVRPEDGLALIPIVSKSILDVYAAAEIPAEAYGWHATPVSTVAVKAVLVSSDTHAQDCELIGRFARQIAGGFEWLTQHGHPKWKRVDLSAPLRGWEQYDCVRKYVGKPAEAESPAASTAERNPVSDAIKGALDSAER
jgi:TRAP transporter TAXI family solute receptor